MSQPFTLVLTGAESSGKTTLAADLAAHFGVPWVPEYARTYLAGRAGVRAIDATDPAGTSTDAGTPSGGDDYTEADVEAIGRGQQAAEHAARAAHGGLLVADTDLLVILVWMRERYGRVPAWIDAALQPAPHRGYVLTSPDMPWAPDPLREHPHARERLHATYRAELQRRGLAFIEVGGSPEARVEAVARWVAAH